MDTKMVAGNFDEFIKKVLDAEMEMLNGTEIGRKLTRELLEKKLLQEPGLTQEEWSKCKQGFLTFIFSELMKNNKSLMEELSGHLYNELRGQ